MEALFPLTYLGPIEYFALLTKYNRVRLERKEHFIKQSFRNRCEIVGANGIQRLSIPTKRKSRERTNYDEVGISRDENWNYLHWRALTTSYRSSPYFEYYEADFERLYIDPDQTLYEFNLKLLKLVLSKLDFDISLEETEGFQKSYDIPDYRARFSSKVATRHEFPRYIQVFEERIGFISNLSILDLLFNEGPASKSYLLKVAGLLE